MDVMNKLQFLPLQTRETPKQERARIRVNTILDAAAALLASNPPHAVSALQIAETAGVPVSSVYRYFPGVEDLFEELLAQTATELDLKIFRIFGDASTYPSWRSRLAGTLACLRNHFAEHPYYGALMALDGPQTLKREKTNSITGYLSTYWAGGGDGFSGGDPAIVAQITMQVIITVENMLVSHDATRRSDKYFEALSINLESFLANYLSD